MEERQNLIQTYMEEFEKQLVDVKNANKALFTQYYIDESGKRNGEWIITRMDGEIKAEGLLVSMILSHIEKQVVLDPVETMLRFNGFDDIDIKYRNITLTTLDTGKSTQESLT